jgi:hypothetical protein
MKTLIAKLWMPKLIEGENFFLIRGRLSFLYIYVGVLSFLPLIFYFNLYHIFLFFGFVFFLILMLNFEIKIDRSWTFVKLKIGLIPFYIIKSKTNNLIIDDCWSKDYTIFKNISIVYPYNGYSKDTEKNLKFTFIQSFDSGGPSFCVDYKDKRIDLFDIWYNTIAWNHLIKGLQNLNNKIS